MDNLIRFDQDWHVSSTFSDGIATVAENVQAAEATGLSSLCVVDRSCRATAWVRDLVDACDAANREAGIEVSSGLELEVLDTNGTLDAPSAADRADHLFIAADRLPTPTGPVDIETAREQIETGKLLPARAMEWLTRAYVGVIQNNSPVVLSRPFGILPHLGIDPNLIHAPYVRWLSGAVLEREACAEVNERWHAPSLSVLDCFLTAGVTILPASGARSPQAIGRFEWASSLGWGLSNLARAA